MNYRERQTEFLRQCLLYDGSSRSDKLAERIRQLKQNESSVQRGAWLLSGTGALAFVGLGCFQDLAADGPGLVTWLIIQVMCVLGLTSLICVPAFVGLGWFYRRELDEKSEECRRLAMDLLESRLAQPRTMARPQAVMPRPGVGSACTVSGPELGHGAAEGMTGQQTASVNQR